MKTKMIYLKLFAVFVALSLLVSACGGQPADTVVYPTIFPQGESAALQPSTMTAPTEAPAETVPVLCHPGEVQNLDLSQVPVQPDGTKQLAPMTMTTSFVKIMWDDVVYQMVLEANSTIWLTDPKAVFITEFSCDVDAAKQFVSEAGMQLTDPSTLTDPRIQVVPPTITLPVESTG